MPTIPFCSRCRVSLVSIAPTNSVDAVNVPCEPDFGTERKIVCPDCKAENEEGAERCVYCDGTLCSDNCGGELCRVELIWPWGKELLTETMRIGRDSPSPTSLIEAINARGYDNISRSHAELIRDSATGGVSLIDLGSTNGTFVDGVRIPANTPICLKGGAVVRFAANLSVVISITNRQD
jgi:hypothetical protein